MTRFAEVIVTAGVPRPFHYRVPPHLGGARAVGARVLVPFRAARSPASCCATRSRRRRGVAKIADVCEVLDDEPGAAGELVELCLWIADYYEAPPGEVVSAALPAGSGVGARVVVALTDAGRAAVDGDGAALPAKQRALLAQLARGPSRRARSERSCAHSSRRWCRAGWSSSARSATRRGCGSSARAGRRARDRRGARGVRAAHVARAEATRGARGARGRRGDGRAGARAAGPGGARRAARAGEERARAS